MLVGVPASLRERAGLSPLVGCLMRVVPVRCSIRGDAPVQAQVDETRRALLDALAQQHGLDAPGVPHGTPAVMLNMRPPRARAILGGSVAATELYLPASEIEHELALEVVSDGDAMELQLTHALARWPAPEAQRLLDRFVSLLDEAAAAPRRAGGAAAGAAAR